MKAWFDDDTAEPSLIPEFAQRFRNLDLLKDRLMRFDVVLANPPYSIKQWDRDAFASDPWGRNLYGTPPQGRADYAFWQHILASMTNTRTPGPSPNGRGVEEALTKWLESSVSVRRTLDSLLQPDVVK
jgi:type I restriction-modification system DNA methylase subunit